MKGTDILKAEHQVILQVLECLQQIVAECRAEGRLDASPARAAIDFFRTFADGCHHGKEESHLFPAMEAKGFSREQGPTGVMLYEHDLGRAHVRAMHAAVAGAAEGDARAIAQFCEQAEAYVGLLRQHIDKEDHCLFNMADQALDAAEQRALFETFQRVESEEMGNGTHEKYLRLADELADRYGVAKATSQWADAGACGCGHARA